VFGGTALGLGVTSGVGRSGVGGTGAIVGEAVGTKVLELSDETDETDKLVELVGAVVVGAGKLVGGVVGLVS